MASEVNQVNEFLGTTYISQDFNLTAALSGALCGFVDNVATLNSTEVGKVTGKLQQSDNLTHYFVVIKGITYWVNESGKVIHCIDSTKKGQILRLITASMASSAGSHQQLTRASTGYDSVLTLNSLEVRDQFAIHALQGLLKCCENPSSFDDASILNICSAAYRWAQGMMQASADARALVASQQESGGGQGGSEITRSSVDVTEGTNSEKLLDNIVKAVDDLTDQVKTSLQSTIKIDNPINDTFKVEGGGGSSNINNILNYSTTDRKICSNYIGFWKDSNNKWSVGENTVEGLTAQIEAAQLVEDNHSPYLWLRKNGTTTINSISTFMAAYGQAIFSSLESTIDNEVNEVAQQGFAVNGNWRSQVETIIAAKVKAEALKT